MDALHKNNEKKPHVVFVPYPAQSHIKGMLKLARLLHHNGIQVTFVNTQSNHYRLFKSTDPNGPGFQFKTIPDGLPSTGDVSEHGQNQTLRCVSSYLHINFLDSFLDLVSRLESPVTCIIADGLMTFANTSDAAERLGVPVMHYWALAACGFMAIYQAKVLVEKGILPLEDESYLTNGYLDMALDWIPGMEGIRLKDLPRNMLVTKDDPRINFCLGAARMAEKVSHIIPTFYELEATLIDELQSIFPHIYSVGPLQLLLNQITQPKTKNSSLETYSLWKEESECIDWLQDKEPNSVVYVSFGSETIISSQELLELGWGLVNSNHYFIWIIREDLVNGKAAVLLQELEEAIKKRGFIASWCPQEEVLNHHSVGGFLTHCGWGSLIESLSAGVPMICRPGAADQPVNCNQMCKKWEVGMELRNVIKRDEVEKLVRELMGELRVTG
uniref:Glycosyltransferase n=1 Tax=Helianthus annuus TaxID=4232 RepID=A0A251VDX6_HELAN